ncbi:NADPH:quinone reductase-like Zn-dependent oxidoreductase [Nonomuraea thailandensis]|uniref:NADPH:quinone reductase-like Zn-dependent oxidoreductase n=1 Tax=Nonomuraea thailandensis TaxID=1188745 RepID=A0A9X2GDJ9_9ACTN|nr:NADP-dependent oxidoreductase [Nonomuraea thailandensis]MCP2356916.1 NADPH:quinone reductase-like Zn-dependent oxidoreductase [Nonomuraea thailandensis]
MRAVQFCEYGPAGVVHVAEVEEPHAGPGTIRVAVRASGLSVGETHIRSGKLRGVVPVTFPFLTGFDAAGVVDEVGEGVTGVSEGDEVFGMTAAAVRGANADHAVLTAWAPKPAAWSWEEAGGAAGAAETATRVLDRLAVGAGHTVLVQGASGGVGTVAVQLAVARGATVIGTARERSHGLLRSLGAEPTTYGPGLAERVRALAPAGVDAVFDCAGGSLPDLVAIAGDPARVVTITPDPTAAALGVHLSHGAPAADQTAAKAAKAAKVEEVAIGAADPLAVHGLGIAAELAARGRLRVPVAAAFPLTEAASAHELSERHHAPGKIVLVN